MQKRRSTYFSEVGLVCWCGILYTGSKTCRTSGGEDQILRASEVPSHRLGLIDNPVPQKDLYEEGFSHSLQVAVTKFRKLQEPKVAKFKGGYSSYASLVFQSWLKDIWVYPLEHCLSQLEVI